jgi:hypothetical protein
MMDGVVALFGTPALARLADLVAMAQEWRPDIIVYQVLEVAGSLLARRLEVPGIVHGIGPMFPLYAQLIGPAGAAIGEPELWTQASSEQALDICPPSLQPDDGPPPWPVATPLRPSAGEPGQVPARVADVLAADGQVAYFTLGTVKNTDTADFNIGLTALEKYDGVVIATTGRHLDPDELGPIPANAIVAEFVPPARRARARRPAGLPQRIGHDAGRPGARRVPQVALPRGTDQPQNAALLARAGAGVLVAPQDYTVETIRTSVREVTDDPSFTTAAVRGRDELAAMPDADTVWAGLAV